MKSTTRIQRLFTFVLTVLIVLLAARPLNATVHNISVGSFFFSPSKTVVSPGDTVRWTMVQGIIHTSTSVIGSPKTWNSGNLALFEAFELAFTVADGPGPFPYNCAIHPLFMIDTIFMAPPQSCCIALRGDFNGDGNNATVLDLTYLIDDIFRGGPASACPEEADINNDGQISTVLDLTFLVDLIFRGGVAPDSCP